MSSAPAPAPAAPTTPTELAALWKLNGGLDSLRKHSISSFTTSDSHASLLESITSLVSTDSTLRSLPKRQREAALLAKIEQSQEVKELLKEVERGFKEEGGEGRERVERELRGTLRDARGIKSEEEREEDVESGMATTEKEDSSPLPMPFPSSPPRPEPTSSNAIAPLPLKTREEEAEEPLIEPPTTSQQSIIGPTPDQSSSPLPSEPINLPSHSQATAEEEPFVDVVGGVSQEVEEGEVKMEEDEDEEGEIKVEVVKVKEERRELEEGEEVEDAEEGEIVAMEE